MKNTTLCYIEKDLSYLMLHRTKKVGDENKDKWIGIGGKLENGESPFDCVRREVKEETGLNVSIEKLIGIYSAYSDKYPNGDEAQPILAFFLCKIDSGELSIDDEETLELRFFKKNDAPPLLNKQHDDMFKDLFSNKNNVIIS